MIMQHFVRLLAISSAFSGVLLLPACSNYGEGYRSTNYGVYSGYGYPYYGRDNYYYYDNKPNNPGNPGNPYRPARPNWPDRPTTLPAQRPGGGMTRPAGGMGRPAGMSRGSGGSGLR